MTRNVTLSADRRWLVAWGVDTAGGRYISVYANAPYNGDGPPIIHERDLTPTRLLEIADEHGVGDIVRATLAGAY